MATSRDLREVCTTARPLIEQWLDIAEQIAGVRDLATQKGLDWSQVKALLKAQIQDERDDASDGKRVRRLVERAEFATAYADMLGLAKMNEIYFSDDHDPETGEVIEHSDVGNPISDQSTAARKDVQTPARHGTQMPEGRAPVSAPTVDASHATAGTQAPPVDTESEAVVSEHPETQVVATPEEVDAGTAASDLAPVGDAGEEQAQAEASPAPEFEARESGAASGESPAPPSPEANIGGEDEAPHHSRSVALLRRRHDDLDSSEDAHHDLGVNPRPAQQAEEPVRSNASASPAPKRNWKYTDKPHPDCLNPTTCGGYSNSALCGRCREAAAQGQVA